MSLLEEKYTVVIKRMTFPIAFMYDPETGDGLDIAMEKARTILNRLPLSLRAMEEYEYEFELESE